MPLRRLAAIVLAVSMLAVSAAAPATAEPRRYEMDPEHFAIAFLVHHVELADTLGMFLEAKGSFVYDQEKQSVSDVQITVDTASVFTNHERRDEHLRSPDFLNVQEYPTMTFTAGEAVRTGEDTGKLKGELTLLGVTRPLTLDVTYVGGRYYPFGDEHYAIGISARGSLKRSDFGMSYAVEPAWVGDEIELIIEFEAKRLEGE